MTPYLGWNYAYNYDYQYFSNINKKRSQKSYDYKVEPKDLTLELLELENLNQATSLKIKPANSSQIAIIGCGPVGMAAALWLKKLYPKQSICIYENRIDMESNSIKPFSRRWLTFIKLDSLEPILNIKDILIIKNIGLQNYIGIDIRNLEYSLLRAIRKQGIYVSQMNNKIPKPEIILDASGGRFINNNKLEIKRKLKINRRLPQIKENFGQKLSTDNKFNQFELVDFGHTIRPFNNGSPLQIPFLKINYLPTKIKQEFIYFSNELNHDYGIYYWNGVMRDDLNHALLFISLLESEFYLIDDLINSPLRLDQAWDSNLFKEKTSKRLSILFEWLLSKIEKTKMCYLEPLFLWEPFLCIRKEMYISDNTKYLRIGDSHYIGNPKVGNGLTEHLKELKNVFSRIQ